MIIEVRQDQIEISPQNAAEEKILRKADIVAGVGVKLDLIWWGDTDPRGKLLQGLKITWIQGETEGAKTNS